MLDRPTARHSDDFSATTPDLARQVVRDGVALARAEMRLLRAELEAGVRAQIGGLIALIVAAGLAIMGLAFAAAAAAAFLAPVVGGFAIAYLIVAGVVLALAGISFLIGRGALSLDALVPRRFMRSMNALPTIFPGDRRG